MNLNRLWCVRLRGALTANEPHSTSTCDGGGVAILSRAIGDRGGRRVGSGRRDIPANINFFMRVPVGADGHVAIADGLSKPGDHVDLRCEKDVIVVISNCPQEFNPCSGGNPTPIRLTVWRPN